MVRTMGDPILEVTVLSPRDVAGAVGGGADRLYLVADGAGSGRGSGLGSGLGAQGGSPEPSVVSAVCRESELPVFALLRLNDTWTTTGGELTRLVGLAEDYLSCGATGLSFGFLDANLEIDVEVCAHLTRHLPGVPWTFHRAVDATLEPRRAWRSLIELPHLVAVRSAGSPQGLAVGYEELLDTAGSDPRIAALLMPGDGLVAEQVPWFARVGVTQFHLSTQVRPGASYKSYVDAGHVRSWRLLVDSAAGRSLGAADAG